MTLPKLIDRARKLSGLGYRLLARRLTLEGLPVTARTLFRWAEGIEPHQRSAGTVRNALQQVIDAEAGRQGQGR